ncbi:hypothetical protein PVL29_022620 [Vitis rotundifolia]|uniref:Uncharacterized protein n=1 Tax=Vitis rotundifolia TaxID=103349 RepID=A0AA38YW15_VITRO|nr:hypothetical protein PVL29_022620 [Vitis rotundifolia]
MATPSRSQSSAIGDEGYFDWREKTRRLRQENNVLQIQASSSGPSHSQHPRSQQVNSKRNDEVVYPEHAESLLGEHDARLDARPLTTHNDLLNESSDSTRVSLKRRRNRKS